QHKMDYLTQSTRFNNSMTDHLIRKIEPTKLEFPFYHYHRNEIVPGISDPTFSVIVPLLAYWVVSILEIPAIEKYRLHEPAELTKRNKVTPAQVIKADYSISIHLPPIYSIVIIYRKLRITPYYLAHHSYPIAPKHANWVLINYGQSLTQWAYWWGLPILQFLWASLVSPYFIIDYTVLTPTAPYINPLEGFILDTLGAVIAHWASGMSVRQATLLFGISTAKTVDDHCGLALPYDPFQHLFGNNAAYHDIHHQQFGIKKNFSQPYFVHWDVLMGTRMSTADAQIRRDKLADLRASSSASLVVTSDKTASISSSPSNSLTLLDLSEDSDLDSIKSPPPITPLSNDKLKTS
ncbi:hypothetical protein PSTT_06290, partial [Puccinia striiformis]